MSGNTNPNEDFFGGIPRGHYEQIDQFTWDVQALIHRYKKEWDLPLESIVGALEFIKTEITAGNYDVYFNLDEEEGGGEHDTY